MSTTKKPTPPTPTPPTQQQPTPPETKKKKLSLDITDVSEVLERKISP